MKHGDRKSNEFGKMAYEEWHGLPDRYAVLELNAFVVMPNHIHGIIHYENMPTKIPDHGIVGATLAAAHDGTNGNVD